MTKTLLISTAFVMLTTSAFAADLPSRNAPPVYMPPPLPVFTWTGLYVGGQVGYAFGRNHLALNGTGGGGDGGEIEPDAIVDTFFSTSQNASGVIGGGHVGYNYQLGGFGGGGLVVGLEGSVDGLSYGSTIYDPEDGETYHLRSNIQGSVRGRIGYAFDRALFYATGGAAFGEFHDTANYNDFGFLPLRTDSTTKNRVGWTVGGGVDYALTPNWSLRAEYRYSDFGSFSYVLANTFGTETSAVHHETEQQVQVGFSYLFTSPVVPVVAKY